VLILWLLATDWAIYRGGGWSGWAFTFAILPFCLLLGPHRASPTGQPLSPNTGLSNTPHFRFWLACHILLLVVSARIVWCGAEEAIFASLCLIMALVILRAGFIPNLMTSLLSPFAVGIGPFVAFIETCVNWTASDQRSPADVQDSIPSNLKGNGSRLLSLLIPAGVLTMFVALFVLANPNLSEHVQQWLTWLESQLHDWLIHIQPLQVAFWVFSATVMVGMLFPLFPQLQKQITSALQTDTRSTSTFSRLDFLYPAARNTLWTVVPLFAFYLVYEFISLGRRDFPPGFYYAGYAHAGAFWLTVALALVTLMLSVIFARQVLSAPQLACLRPWAWFWAGETFVLALAVYNRLLIYIDFNGMTRMRVIGLLGVTAVVAGVVLVVLKIVKDKPFLWLIERQFWALTLAIISYASLPLDWLVHNYNANCVLRGDLAPSVQMIAHPTRAEGILQILRLVDCEDEEIREGVRAMGAEWLAKLVEPSSPATDWSDFQLSHHRLLTKLQPLETKLAPYSDPSIRQRRLQQFYDYAYQWY
jgi:hypothetical protein